MSTDEQTKDEQSKVESKDELSIHEQSIYLTSEEHIPMLGIQFNQYPGKFVKFLADDMIHNGFKFNIGLNVDTNTWSCTTKCQNGIYFTTVESATMWSSVSYRDHKWIADVKIPNTASVSVFNSKIKADRVILSNLRLVSDMPEWKSPFPSDWNRYIRSGYLNLRYLPSDGVSRDEMLNLLRLFVAGCLTWEIFVREATKLNDQLQILCCVHYLEDIHQYREYASPLMINYLDATNQERKLMANA